MTRRLPCSRPALLLAACATPRRRASLPDPLSLPAWRGDGRQPLSLAQAVDRVKDADIVLVGELPQPSRPCTCCKPTCWHSWPGCRASMAGRWCSPPEQFSRADQPVLDAYLAGRIGEAALIRDSHAWPNYPSDYRPWWSFARRSS